MTTNKNKSIKNIVIKKTLKTYQKRWLIKGVPIVRDVVQQQAPDCVEKARSVLRAGSPNEIAIMTGEQARNTVRAARQIYR
jgi:hypothetical protein